MIAPLKRRKAKYTATLIYVDEPQLVLLKDKDVPVVGLAIPDGDASKAMFIATTAMRRDWQAYLDGNCDLRYLFTYPKVRRVYTFDLNTQKDGEVLMEPFTGEVPEDYLPHPRMFSVFHTEELPADPLADGEEILIVDGEWDMPEFGTFYQRYSDIYAFIAATKNAFSQAVSPEAKKAISQTFTTKPFQGGFSYVHFFQELVEKLQRTQRLGLEKISYASPGTVEIRGDTTLFNEMKDIVPNFIENRAAITRQYGLLHGYLSRNKYLQMAGEHYHDVPAVTEYISTNTQKLAELMCAPDYQAVSALSRENPLVTAKIILSFHRRLDEAAAYFAQGRVSYQ